MLLLGGGGNTACEFHTKHLMKSEPSNKCMPYIDMILITLCYKGNCSIFLIYDVSALQW